MNSPKLQETLWPRSALRSDNGGNPLDEAVREGLARNGAGNGKSGATWFPRSLTRAGDSVYIAIEEDGRPLLLQYGGTPAQNGLTTPIETRAIDAVNIYVYPFSSSDYQNIAAFAERIDLTFLPRPQRAMPAIAAGNRHPEISLPALFEGYREILQERDLNLASTVQLSATREMTTDAEISRRDGSIPTAPGHTRVSIRHLYHAGLWSAIRAGFRYGYTAEADHFIVSGATDEEIARSVEVVKEAIVHASGYTKFTTDTSRVFDLRADARHPQPLSESAVEELFVTRLTPEERAWVLAVFSRRFDMGSRVYSFDAAEIKRLAVKFVPSLKLNEELFDAISEVKNGAQFDFEPSLDEAETLTSAKELIFYMHWLKERGRPAQLVPPNLGFKKRQAYPESRVALEKYAHHKMWPEVMPRVDAQFAGDPIAELKDRVRELAEVANYFDGTLSIHSGSGKQPEVLRSIGSATRGRLNYKISGELQLQLFDVLSESPERSSERQLYDAMVAVCEQFAAAGAFGEESALAAQYRGSGHGSYLGNAAAGRVDGNLFLVFWLGNMVGCRDRDGSFFKEKLDEAPKAIIEETQRRNRDYLKWLATHLFCS